MPARTIPRSILISVMVIAIDLPDHEYRASSACFPGGKSSNRSTSAAT